MTNACPILPPEQRQTAEILGRIKDEMMRKIHAVLLDATDQVRVQVSAAGLPSLPPQDVFFASIVHQHMYCVL